jgi:hypothetical protein
VAGLHNRGHEPGRRVVTAHGNHLPTRHHDVAHLQVGHFEHALEHDAGVVVDHTALARRTQNGDEIVAILRLTQRLPDLPEPPARGVQILRHAAVLEPLMRLRMGS